MRFHQSDVFVVNIAVANRVDEPVDADFRRSFASSSADVRSGARGFPSRFVCLVDDRAIHLGLELRHSAFTIVNPELDEMDAPRVQTPEHAGGPLRGRRAVGNAQARFAGGPAIEVAAMPFPTVRNFAASG